MQKLQSHYRWFKTIHRLRISAILVALFLAFTNATLFLLTQTPQNVDAQTVPVLVETIEVSQQTEVVQVVATSPATVQVTTPQPVPDPTPVPAPTPAPAFDKVSIASIGLSSQFVAVGLTNTNAVDVHPSLVGWWNGSAQPGNPGAIFLDGHNPGVFSTLPSVKEGAQINLTKASGEIFNYTVVYTEIIQLAGGSMNTALTPYGGASEGLNLMTCIGTYSTKTGTTDQRLIVYAVRS